MKRACAVKAGQDKPGRRQALPADGLTAGQEESSLRRLPLAFGFGARLQMVQVADGALGMAGSNKDRALVAGKNLQ